MYTDDPTAGSPPPGLLLPLPDTVNEVITTGLCYTLINYNIQNVCVVILIFCFVNEWYDFSRLVCDRQPGRGWGLFTPPPLKRRSVAAMEASSSLPPLVNTQCAPAMEPAPHGEGLGHRGGG